MAVFGAIEKHARGRHHDIQWVCKFTRPPGTEQCNEMTGLLPPGVLASAEVGLSLCGCGCATLSGRGAAYPGAEDDHVVLVDVGMGQCQGL